MRVRRPVLVTVLSLCSPVAGMSLAAPVVAATPPVIEQESVLDVAATSATPQAQIDPQGGETTYRFEYGTTAAYGSVLPSPDGSAGESRAVTVSVVLQNLLPATTYHFRVVATSDGGTVVGGDEAFTTQSLGSSLSLPDGREWELVSPVEKHGQQILPVNGSVSQAAEDGGAVTYTTSGPFGAESPANVTVAQILSRRGPSGWASQNISPPQEGAVATGNTDESEYVLFSPDLARSMVEPFGQTLLSSTATERTLYVRDDSTGSYEALVTSANTLPGTKVGEVENYETPDASIVTATPDMSHIVLRMRNQKLTQGNSELKLSSERVENYYEWVGGRLRLIDELPVDEGEVSADSVTVGAGALRDLRHAISDDGSRIFWGLSDAEGGTLGHGYPLYMGDMVTGETVRINKAQGVSEPAGNNAEFQGASSDGSVAFFNDEARLTTAPGGGLYAYDVESGRLTLLTVPKDVSETAGVKGMLLGFSEDGSYVYFVASGVLSENESAAGERAVAGANNLYVVHNEVENGTTDWKTSFIAALTVEDSPDWSVVGLGTKLSNLTARVSPGGRYVTFMSDASLTGYDNLDTSSAQRDEEVFLYDAQTGRLRCVSCNPTGARPVGRLTSGNSPMTDLSNAWPKQWLAASVPGWLHSSSNSVVALYQPRYLSDSGRLFFDSSDALVPQDTNGSEDVYEFEPEGVGDCSGSDTTYSGGAAGCIALISGGAGEQESAFMDASTSGDDVFFATTEGLVRGDVDNVYDLYDAHVCRAEVPCAGPGAASSPPCETADSCKAPPSPQPPVFGSPASATFTGAGNVVQPSVPITRSKPKKKVAKCAKGRRLSRGRCVRAKTKRRTKASKAGDKRRLGR